MRHLLILLALIAAPAGAGTRATYAGSDGRTLVIEVADDGDARIGVPGEADYGVLHGGRFHVVGSDRGRPTVARVEDVAAAMDRVMPPIFRDAFAAAPARSTLTIARDGSETVNGRTGARYRVTGAGEPRTLVVSDDPALAPVGAALAGFTTAAILPMAALIGPPARTAVADTRALFALGTPLATPNGLRLTSVETRDVPAARVALPAAPLSVAALVAEMQAAQKKR